MQTIQSSDAPIELRVASTGTWKTLVCVENYNIPVNTPTTSTDTFCGRAVGLGIIEFTPTVSAVCEAAPTVDQVSYHDLLAWQASKTKLEFRVQNPASGSIGNLIYLSGECYITNTELQGAAQDILKFSTTITGQGTLDITP